MRFSARASASMPRRAKARDGAPASYLPNKLQSKLNLSLRCNGPDERSSNRIGGSGPIKNIRIAVAHRWRTKVGMIQNVKKFSAELDVETLGNAPDIVVLIYGKVQIRKSWAD